MEITERQALRKIMILCNSSGGLYDFRNELPLRLLQAGTEVVVSVPDDVRAADLTAEGCKVVHTDIDRRGTDPVKDMKLIRAYGRLLDREKPDLVLTYTIKPNIYGGICCRRRHIPYMATVTGLGSAFQNEGIKKKLITWLYRQGLKGAECVFFQNDHNRDVFRSLGILGGGKTRLVSGSGVDLEHHLPAEYPGHADQVIRFLYVGRLMREKGTMEYLEAARRLHEKYGDRVSAAAVGYCDDDLEDAIKRAEKEGILRMIPFDKEIRPYYREADCVVMPSYHEGMSNVLMEAAATARPVIATDIPGCRETVEEGQTGFLCRPRDSSSLYDAMCRIVGMSEDERRRMGLQGRKKMELEFDRHHVIDAYIEEINI